jgi:hypothetical protein
MKTCSKCGETKALDSYHKDPKVKDGRTARCRECCSIIRKERFLEDPEKIRAQKNASNARHRDTKKKYDIEYNKRNAKIIRIKQRNYKYLHLSYLNEQANINRKKKREELSDLYIKQLINGKSEVQLKLHEVPQALIEAKRLQLLIWRMANENSNAIT